MGSLRSLRRREVEPVPLPTPTDEELIQAICSGTIKEVNALLAQGANPNAMNSYANTALGHAAHLGKLRMARAGEKRSGREPERSVWKSSVDYSSNRRWAMGNEAKDLSVSAG